MTGRKSIPSHIKLVRGNPGKRAVNKDEPTPAKEKLNCPKGLSIDAKKLFPKVAKILHKMGVLTIADEMALVLLCETYAEWMVANRAIKKHKDTVYESHTKNGGIMYRSRPEVAHRTDAARRLQSLLNEFGLTPASRSKISAGKENDNDPFGEFF